MDLQTRIKLPPILLEFTRILWITGGALIKHAHGGARAGDQVLGEKDSINDDFGYRWYYSRVNNRTTSIPRQNSTATEYDFAQKLSLTLRCENPRFYY